MVELKSKNLFIKKGGAAVYTISKILDFYDLIGKNILYMGYHGSTLSGLLKCNKKNFTPGTFSNVLKDNLFRVDIIVIDSNSEWRYNHTTLRKITDLPVIFIIDNSSLLKVSIDDFDRAYAFSKDENKGFRSILANLSGDRLEDYKVEDLKEGWSSNLKDLKVQYIRDKNLRDLLGDVD
jgi:hypothetical protein